MKSVCASVEVKIESNPVCEKGQSERYSSQKGLKFDYCKSLLRLLKRVY